MDYLLDTHAFLWFINGDAQISAKAKNAILNPNAIKYISIASLWEIAIKINIRKLDIGMSLEELKQHILMNGFELLPISFSHIAFLADYSFVHGDPFDKMLIAQCITDNLCIISRD